MARSAARHGPRTRGGPWLAVLPQAPEATAAPRAGVLAGTDRDGHARDVVGQRATPGPCRGRLLVQPVLGQAKPGHDGRRRHLARLERRLGLLGALARGAEQVAPDGPPAAGASRSISLAWAFTSAIGRRARALRSPGSSGSGAASSSLAVIARHAHHGGLVSACVKVLIPPSEEATSGLARAGRSSGQRSPGPLADPPHPSGSLASCAGVRAILPSLAAGPTTRPFSRLLAIEGRARHRSERRAPRARPLAIEPDHLDQVALPATQHDQRPRIGVEPQRRLRLRRQRADPPRAKSVPPAAPGLTLISRLAADHPGSSMLTGGLLGAGRIGTVHARAIASHPGSPPQPVPARPLQLDAALDGGRSQRADVATRLPPLLDDLHRQDGRRLLDGCLVGREARILELWAT